MSKATLILALALTTNCWAYSGGSGTLEDPYLIATSQDLINLGNDPCNYDKRFILTADIDLASHPFDDAPIAPDVDQNDCEFQGTPFTGVLDGQGHSISNLTIQGSGGYLGLFGYLDCNAVVTHLGLESAVVDGNDTYTGPLAAYNLGRVSWCHSTGAVSHGAYLGGLVGLNKGYIAACYSSCSVKDGRYTGGLVGQNVGTITACYTTGSINQGVDAGGLVGMNYGAIVACYSSAIIHSYCYGGGLVGANESGAVTSCYSTGWVDSWKSGGLVGSSDRDASLSFWDIETSGQNESDGGTGLTTTEMQKITTYQDAQWDLVDENSNGTSNFWQIQSGQYPTLAIFDSGPEEPNGSGTKDDPYVINDCNELGSLWSRAGRYSQLNADIDLSGIVWNKAVIPGFNGYFDGHSHTISNLHIHGSSYVGLVGYLCQGATITNLSLENIEVHGDGSRYEARYVGGLAGYSEGNITYTHGSGKVEGGYLIGGLVGLHRTGTIHSCSSNIPVRGDECVGGLAGYLESGHLSSCQNMGAVQGDHYIGGLVGLNDGDISSGYNSGTVDGNDYIGGGVGYNVRGNITSSRNNGSINGDLFVGGLIGDNDEGTITSSYNRGDVNGTDCVGGLIGRNLYGSTVTCSNKGTISGDKHIGGLIGYNHYGRISSCYNNGHIEGNKSIGGLVGLNTGDLWWKNTGRGFIDTSYSSGTLRGNFYVGGLVGDRLGGLCNESFWDIETSGVSESDGGMGLTTSLMQDTQTFLKAGWDFTGETDNGTDNLWWISGQDYPRLWWEH